MGNKIGIEYFFCRSKTNKHTYEITFEFEGYEI